jgi:hypothetical protein
MNTHSTIEELVSKQWIDKHTIMGLLLEMLFAVRFVQSDYEEEFS